MATHPNILAWEIQRISRGAWWATVQRVAKQLEILSAHTHTHTHTLSHTHTHTCFRKGNVCTHTHTLTSKAMCTHTDTQTHRHTHTHTPASGRAWWIWPAGGARVSIMCVKFSHVSHVQDQAFDLLDD